MAERHTTVFGDQIDLTACGAGIVKDTNDNLEVNVDDSSIEISTDTLQVKALGITNAMLAGSISDDKLVETYLKATDVDDVTIEFTATSGGGGYLNVKDGGIDTTQLADDAVDKDKIASDVAGLGLGQNVDGSLEVNVDDSSIEISTDTLQVKASGITNAMLAGSITDDKLDSDYIQTSEVDDVTIEATAVSGGGVSLNVKDGGIDTTQLADEAVTEGKIEIFNAPTQGYYLKYTSNGLEWADVDADAVQESDFIFHEIPSGLINSTNVTYTLANTPVAGTVQVFLNGLLQAPGGGLDYTISGSTITFVKAPRTNSDLYVHYIVT